MTMLRTSSPTDIARCKGTAGYSLKNENKGWFNSGTWRSKKSSDLPYSASTGVQDLSGLKRSIFMNSLRVPGPKSFS
jgi:hypothetical protein